jgi:predicted KAP-like P-loop ATPase
MNSKRAARSKNSYSADRPISSEKEDILGRAKFAARLADDVHSWEGEDSLVIALYGAWGSGKTSVKNILLEAVRKKRRKPLRVIDFNPWQLSGTGGIPAAFFRELGIALNENGPKRDAEKRSKLLNAYATTLSVAGRTVGLVGKVMPLAGIPGGQVVEAVGAGVGLAAESTRSGSEALKAKAETAEKGLEQQKRELAEILAKMPQSLLVVIDDIDRLTTDEILQVFQLVKANADFPKLIYLLLFEREVVTKALNQISGDKGAEFLEKIVQVGYHVPHASRDAVQKVLFAGLNKHIENSPTSKHWEKHRWRHLYADGIGGYFRNLRHVYRFLSSFTFQVQHHLGKDSIEVNPVDLIGLETLRVFEPAIFERLPGAKAILTRYDGSNLFGEIKQETIDQAMSQITLPASPETQTRVRTILEMLFPPATSQYAGEDGVSRYQAEWLRGLRICHPDLFDKYFTLTIPDDDLSQAELERLLSLASNVAGFVATCDALRERGMLKVAFDRLDAYKEHIPIHQMPTLIEALCNMGDDLPIESANAFESDEVIHATRLIHFGLKRETDSAKRKGVLLDAFSRSTGLALPVEIVNANERTRHRLQQGLEFLVKESDLPELKRVCVDKIRRAAEATRLRENPRLNMLLRCWSQWAPIEEARAWIASQIRSARDAAWLLATLMNESHSWGVSQHRVNHYILLSQIERFADVEMLSRLVGELGKSALSPRETKAIQAFRGAMIRRSQGRPDNQWSSDWEAGEREDAT